MSREGKNSGELDEAKDIKLFCFAWITNRSKELAVLPDMKDQLAGCDGHAIFGHEGTNHPDVIEVPEARSHTIGHDMVHLIPTWTHLLKNVKNLDEHDWILNIEWDHLVRPSKVRLNIARDLGVLQRGTESEQASMEEPMMLMWGNSFLFNRRLVQEMRRQWPSLSKTIATTGENNGCPEWHDDHKEPGRCAQDISYPQMLEHVERGLQQDNRNTHVRGYGRPGCSQIAKSDLGEEFHLACFNMPTGGSQRSKEFNPTVSNQLEVIKAIQRGEPYRDHGSDYDLKDVPILHKVYDPSVHELGRKLLGESHV